jgi:hypothetical protein
MNFVTVSDFDKDPYSLPAKDVQSSNFSVFMKMEEEKILRKHFGHIFYDELIANGLYLPEQKWEKIVYGSYYTLNEVTYKWVGLNKMLVPYLYFMRTKVTIDSHTATGIESAKVENAIKKSPRQRMSDAWNEFTHAYGVCKNKKDSLYGFISANSIDYENFIYSDPKAMNPYGL